MKVGTWYRFSLATGEWVDGQLAGGDPVAYFVRFPDGVVYSIQRANVLVVTVVPNR